LDSNQKKIDFFRQKIDYIDSEIIKLLNERAKYAKNIGKLKQKLNIPVYSPGREEQIIAGIKTTNRGPLNKEAIKRIYKHIIEETRRLENGNFDNDNNQRQDKVE
jgi:chorismate mutase-like protein